MALCPSPDLKWPSSSKGSLVLLCEGPAVHSHVACRADCTVTRSMVLLVQEAWFGILALLLTGFVIMDKLFSITESQFPITSLG